MIPNWAKDLAVKVLQEHDCKVIPDIHWYRCSSFYSSGVTYYDREKGISIRAGKRAERWEQKMVLLHELAHWLRPNRDCHSFEFWKLAFQLYKENHIPIRKARRREGGYKKGSENGYRAVMGLKLKKASHERQEINRISKLPMYAVTRIKRDWKGKCWALTRFAGSGDMATWEGYKISESLFRRLQKQGIEILS